MLGGILDVPEGGTLISDLIKHGVITKIPSDRTGA